MWAWQYVFETPMDELHTRTYLVNARNFFTSALLDGVNERRNARIVGEDQRDRRAARAGAAGDDGLYGRPVGEGRPAMQVHYRQQSAAPGRRAAGASTWPGCAPPRPVRRLFLVPSPPRRESRNWVFDTVPLRAAP
jgi:hypothetical protein